MSQLDMKRSMICFGNKALDPVKILYNSDVYKPECQCIYFYQEI